MRGINCGDPPFAHVNEFYIYRSGGKTGKPSQKFLFDSQNFAAIDHIKKNFNVDLYTVDKSVSLFSRIKFELKRNAFYLMFGIMGALTALIYRKKRQKRANP